MEIEYEASPVLPQYAGGPVRPPPAGSSPDIAGEGDEEEEGDIQETEVAAKKQPAAKRIIKQRQSLAEKEKGTTIFPKTRVVKIAKADDGDKSLSSEAIFMISVATEYFIKHFMEEGYTKARLDKRKIVNYKDMAAVVARSAEFDFLKDVIPAPIPISEALERRKQKMLNDDNPMLYDEEHPTQARDTIPDDLPPLVPSTNPLFPNAIVRKPANTHSKGSSRPGPPPALALQQPRKEPSTPRLVGGKNAPSTPHSLTTRGAARRSTVGGEGEGESDQMAEELGAGEEGQEGLQMRESEIVETAPRDDEKMDED